VFEVVLPVDTPIGGVFAGSLAVLSGAWGQGAASALPVQALASPQPGAGSQPHACRGGSPGCNALI
jgi:hypothetical protein